MRWLVPLWLSLVLGCSSAKQPRQPRAGEVVLSVMSYNLNYGMAGDAETLKVIEEGNADLVVLQETTDAWEKAIRARLGQRYPYMSFRHCCGAGGLAIVSKLPFAGRDYVKASVGWFPAWRVVVDTDFGPVQVLNVHLRPQVSDSGSVVSGYFTTPAVRDQEIREYHATLDADLPTLIVGDFNESASGRALDYLRTRGLVSVVPEFQPGADTWRWHTSVGTVHAELDHIVYNARLEPLGARVIEGGRSDHYPILATFRRAPASARSPRGASASQCTSSLGC